MFSLQIHWNGRQYLAARDQHTAPLAFTTGGGRARLGQELLLDNDGVGDVAFEFACAAAVTSVRQENANVAVKQRKMWL